MRPGGVAVVPTTRRTPPRRRSSTGSCPRAGRCARSGTSPRTRTVATATVGTPAVRTKVPAVPAVLASTAGTARSSGHPSRRRCRLRRRCSRGPRTARRSIVRRSTVPARRARPCRRCRRRPHRSRSRRCRPSRRCHRRRRRGPRCRPCRRLHPSSRRLSAAAHAGRRPPGRFPCRRHRAVRLVAPWTAARTSGARTSAAVARRPGLSRFPFPAGLSRPVRRPVSRRRGGTCRRNVPARCPRAWTRVHRPSR